MNWCLMHCCYCYRALSDKYRMGAQKYLIRISYTRTSSWLLFSGQDGQVISPSTQNTFKRASRCATLHPSLSYRMYTVAFSRCDDHPRHIIEMIYFLASNYLDITTDTKNIDRHAGGTQWVGRRFMPSWNELFTYMIIYLLWKSHATM